MSLFCLKTHDLSWQDRTINVELMIAPARSQLLFNKHKGLKTKYEQVSQNLDREKDSFMRSYKTDQRLMEMKKERYSKRRNDIIQKRANTDYLGRRRSSLPVNLFSDNKFENAFITELPTRESKSAGARIHFQSHTPTLRDKTPEHTRPSLLPVTPDMRIVSACSTARSATPGKPFLQREKSVRFEHLDSKEDEKHVCEHIKSRVVFNVPIEERIKDFLNKQNNFNTSPASAMLPRLPGEKKYDAKQFLVKRPSALKLNLVKLESAFDDFCSENGTDGFQKLVKYASKMKASVRNARNSILEPCS
ncbi:hypothetical protein ACF0H5_022148 [Mactra antiquata]